MECEDQIDDIEIQNDDSEESQTTLLSLNDYCLLKVFDYLYIIDAISLGNTCTTLQRVSGMAAIKYKKFSNVEYRRYCNYSAKPLSIEKILSYIAPCIESLQLCSWKMMVKNDGEFKLSIMEDNFIKLKSLSINTVGILKSINACNVEKLTINVLRHGDLNNSTYGMTRLKKLKVSSVAIDVSNDEFKHFLENYPDLEQLIFFATLPAQLEHVSFSKLQNLQHLEFHVDIDVSKLMWLLRIEKLAVLKIEFNQTFERVICLRNTWLVLQFLRKLARKKTLKSLELRSMNFNDDLIFGILSSLNLVSLRIVCPMCSANICAKIANTSFATLTDLDIVTKLDDIDTLNLIGHLQSLERLTVFILDKYDSPKFLNQLNELLKNTARDRPDLELNNQMESSIIKVRFNLRCYEINTTTNEANNKEKRRAMFEVPRRISIRRRAYKRIG